MDKQRNADKDRDIIERAGYFYENIGALDELASHWLERAVVAEQRVSKLESLQRDKAALIEVLETVTKHPIPELYKAYVVHMKFIDCARTILAKMKEPQ